MTDLAVKFKLLDCFVERHAVIPPHMCILPPFYSISMKRTGKAVEARWHKPGVYATFEILGD